jgi:hypothetical protein
MSKFEIKKLNDTIEEETTEFFLEIVEGKFQGIQFKFGAIEFAGEDENGNGKINFNYELLTVPEEIKLSENTHEDLHETLGDILQEILEGQILNSTEELHDTGNLDSDEFIE